MKLPGPSRVVGLMIGGVLETIARRSNDRDAIMAYVGHSSFDHGVFRLGAGRLSAPLIFRSALVAVAVAAAVLALSDGDATTSAATQAAAVKADRIGRAAAIPGEAGLLTTDPAARTTTVVRGTVATISPDSPWAAEAK